MEINEKNNGRVSINSKDYDVFFAPQHFSRSQNGYADFSSIRIWLSDKNGKRAFFKNNSIGSQDSAEIFAMYLAKELGLRCVDVKPANLNYNEKSYSGILSFDYMNNKEKGSEVIKPFLLEVPNSVLGYLKKIKQLSLREGFVISKNLKNDLLKLCFFDFLTFQKDRHNANIEFYLSKNQNGEMEINLSEIFDNSLIYFCNFDSFIDEDLNYFSTLKSKDFQQKYFLEKENIVKKLSQSPYISKYCCFNIIDSSDELDVMFAKEMMDRPFLMDMFNKFCKIDFFKLQERIFDETGFKIDDKFIIISTILKDLQIYSLNQNLKKQKELNQGVEHENWPLLQKFSSWILFQFGKWNFLLFRQRRWKEVFWK